LEGLADAIYEILRRIDPETRLDLAITVSLGPEVADVTDLVVLDDPPELRLIVPAEVIVDED
jgi:hypothetical protein